MPSARDLGSVPVALPARTPFQVVSDRLAAAGLDRDQPIPAAREPVSNPVGITQNLLGPLILSADTSDTKVEAAMPDPQEANPRIVAPGDQSPPPLIAASGHLSGSGESSIGPSSGGSAKQASDVSWQEQPRTGKVPLVASVVGLAAPDLPSLGRRELDESEVVTGGPPAEAPVVRNGLLSPSLDHRTTSSSVGLAEQRSSGPPVDNSAFGFASGGADGGGTNLDLSKTNELLQQILDALGRQANTSSTPLPTAGPSVYADRS